MQTAVALLLVVLALSLYFAKRLLPNDRLERLANSVAVASLVAAALVFLVPAATTRGQLLSQPEASSLPSPVPPSVPAPLPTSPELHSTSSPSQPTTGSPTTFAHPEVYLDYPLALPLAIGPGRVDLLRLYNSSGEPLSIVSYGAEFVFQSDTIVVSCEKGGFCLDSSPLPEGVSNLTVSISPERLCCVGEGTPTPDPYFIYPLLVEPGATDFIAKIAVVLPDDHEPFTERVLVAPFILTSRGEKIDAPYIVAVAIP